MGPEKYYLLLYYLEAVTKIITYDRSFQWAVCKFTWLYMES